MVSTFYDFLMPEKIKKAKNFQRLKQKPGMNFLRFLDFFSFLWSIGRKKPCPDISLIFEAIKAKKSIQRPKHTISQKHGSNSLNLVSLCKNNNL